MSDETWQEFLDYTVDYCSSNDLLKPFQECSSDIERMRYISNNQFLNNSVEKWLSKNLNSSASLSKNSKLATKYKTDGNKAYSTGKDDIALNFYSEGLLHATQKELSLLYGNRSAVLYRKGEYIQCLYDIQAAIENGFPRDKIWKLYTREGECLFALKHYQLSLLSLEKSLKLLDSKNFEQRMKIKDLINDVISEEKFNGKTFANNSVSCLNDLLNKSFEENSSPIVSGNNPKIVNASSSLELKLNNDEGRHIVANNDVNEGSVIIKETPYACVLLPPWYETHCQHCLQQVKYLYPCKCCTQVRYCSDKCRKESWEEYHHFECGKLSLMEKIGIAHLSLRIILVTNIEELTNKKFNLISKEYHSEVYENSYESVFNLLTNSNYMAPEDLMQYSLAALLLQRLLCNCNYFTRQSLPNEKCIIIASRLLRHILQLVCNAHAVTSLSYSESSNESIVEQDQCRIATAIYPTTSLLNHSCEPTIINCFHKNQLIVKLAKSVKKGDQIYNCYGPHFRRMVYNDRQKALKEQYFFTCNCEHCIVGDKREKEYNCFACSKCRCRIEDDYGCTNCGHEFESDVMKKIAEHADVLFYDNLDLLKTKQYEEKSLKTILNELLTCLKLQNHVYFKKHYQIALTNDLIAKCYAMMKDYRSALSHLRKSFEIIKIHYGEKSIEAANEILKHSDLYVAIAKQYVNGQAKENDSQLLQEGIWIFEDGIKLVRLNKEENCEDLTELKEKLGFLQCVISRK